MLVVVCETGRASMQGLWTCERHKATLVPGACSISFVHLQVRFARCITVPCLHQVYLQRFAPFIAVQQPVAIPYEEYTGELEYMLSVQYDVMGGALHAFEDALEMTRALTVELPRMDLPPVSQARRAEECRQLEQVTLGHRAARILLKFS